jgi:NADH dehydrogenase FAD-containing subunit
LSEKTRHRVVIVGGGFGGVFTAKHLAGVPAATSTSN